MFNFLASEYTAVAARNPLAYLGFCVIFFVGIFLSIAHPSNWPEVKSYDPVVAKQVEDREKLLRQKNEASSRAYCAEKRLPKMALVWSETDGQKNYFNCDGSYLKAVPGKP